MYNTNIIILYNHSNNIPEKFCEKKKKQKKKKTPRGIYRFIIYWIW